jgi:hypothetical protein
VNRATTSAFNLPDHLTAKADPALIGGDEQHFAAIGESLEQSIADLSDRLDAERKAPGGIGQEAMDRDMQVRRLTSRLRALRRFGLDLCLLAILMDSHGGDVPADLLRKSLLQNEELRATFNRAWPLLEAADLVADLWSVPAYLRMCAPWLSPDEVAKLQRREARAWTVSDLPLLDAARQRLGDPEASRRRRQHEAAVAAEREQMARVVDDLIEAARGSTGDEYGVGLVTMLRGQDFQDALVDQAALPGADPDLLAGPFAHIVVDEAQELTDAQWQMLLLRCPSRSFTIVGTVPRPGTGSPNRGRNGSSGSGSTRSTSRR